jgi:hypothetical protein
MRMSCLVLCAALCALTSVAHATESKELILNEWNCVRIDHALSGSDSVFGTATGNGGNWIELVVTEDVDSLVGYTLFWQNAGGGSNHNGTITLVDPGLSGVWDDLVAGSIITIMEVDDSAHPIAQGPPGNPSLYRTSDISYNGTTDKWIHVTLDDDRYVTHVHGFIVDNDNWKMKIMTAASGGSLVQDWVGESVTGWLGGGINSFEIGKLQADADNFDLGDYDAGDNSTFGAPNTWSGGMAGQAFPW